MDLEKCILATITTNPNKVAQGMGVFYCESVAEMEQVAIYLEAILDGIAHALTKEIYIIVKH